MSIFDIFTFKKEGRRIFSAENFEAILTLARNEIIKQKGFIEKKGAEKKACVDAIVISKVTEIRESCSNKVIKWLLDLMITAIPSVTQLVYEFLKEKVEKL